MTLPFRRRHNDAEASHDRARALTSTGFAAPNEPADAIWLAKHLQGCSECAGDATAYAADRELLRALRSDAPEPPRDLWARTAAAIEQESSGRGRAPRILRAPRSWRIGGVPAGVVSGLLVIVVVLGVSFAPRGIPVTPTGPIGSDVAVATPLAEATSITVAAYAVAWVQSGPDGYEFRRASVESVCPAGQAGCATLDTGSTTRLELSAAPQAVVQSPSGSAIVVVTSAASVAGAEIVVVPVPPAKPDASASPTASADPENTPPTPSVEPSGSAEPSQGQSIVSGIAIVGDAAYASDGQWLAFSARPADGSSGPDLYLWHVGDDLARKVTSNHRTFFIGWLGNQVIANVVVPTIDESPIDRSVPVFGPWGSPAPARSPEPTNSPEPSVTPDPSAPVVEEHPVAFTLDPETGATVVLGAQDMWHPTVDPKGRSVVYWAGTLVADGAGTGWNLGTGQLVIDGWVAEPPAPEATDQTFAPVVWAPRPAGHPVSLGVETGSEFDAWFDPSGLRLAVWTTEATDEAVGILRLFILDPDTLQIDPNADPLPGVAALRGVSIDEGRLAWITPPGQDGEGSHVQVMAWRGRSFGQVRTIQAERLVVAR